MLDHQSIAIDANDFSVLDSAQEYFSYLVEAIKQANRRIYITALYLQHDQAGEAILTALYEAKVNNPQLDIKVFVDAHRAQRGLIGEKAQLGNRAMYLDYANRYPVELPIYGVAVKNKEVFGVLHLKGMVFDDDVLYTGASINDVYCHQQNKYRLDRYHKISSVSLANSFCAYLNQTFVNSGYAPQLNIEQYPELPERRKLIQQLKRLLSVSQYKIEPVATQSGDIKLTPLVGFGARKNQLNKQVRKTIQSSQQKVVLFTPYFNMPKVVVRDLAKALKRGVHVEITVGDKTANDFYIEDPDEFSTIGAIPYLYEILLVRFVKRWQKYINSGQLVVRLWRHDKNSYHLKGISVDDSLHLITGSNVNPRAWALDLENGIQIDDPKQLLKDKFQAEVDVIYQNTTIIKGASELQSLKDYPAKPQKLIKKLRLTQIDHLLKRLL